MLYEETLRSKWIIALLVPPVVAMAIGLYVSLSRDQAVTVVPVAMGITVAVVLEVMAIRIQIYEDRILITGYLGFMIRKMVKLNEIEWFAVKEGWTSCNAPLHFTVPAKACVYLKRRRGWDISFSTSRPEELMGVLTSLGVPRGA
ncbi:hypothetical protein [Thermococcus sp.]